IKEEALEAARKYLREEFQVANFKTTYSKTAAEDKYDYFETVLEEFDQKQQEFDNYVADKIAEINACYEKYHSENTIPNTSTR
ncbi:MAG: hypothetical protein J5903_04270, partial [Clostridia bacterium]|nr:hypothetical protein [Clostridia bacterium]